ncbi:MAG: DNA recombination protein RmuC [Pseudohongiellaceae bacterium]|jgi:DNA recombination protein RmuC
MDPVFLTVLALLTAVAVVAIVILLLQVQKLRLAKLTSDERLAARDADLSELQQQYLQLRQERDSLTSELQSRREENASLRTSLDMEKQQTEEKLKLLQDSEQKLSVAFKNIANEIFEDKSKKFTSVNKDSLATVLGPLQEKIQHFEKRVEETYDKESKERFSLAKEIKNLQELNARISEEAVNLTNALKGDNKAQGSWGEFVLESILEKSGLVKGREYEVQVNLRSEDGSKLQPDVIVHLPEQRDIIIDSKVSLKAWDAYCAAEQPGRKGELLKQHIQSLRLHVKNLAGKDYQNLPGVNSLDYVFLFMPIEAAYSEAVREDPDLFQFAFERNIIFVVPSTLLTTLKTVQNLWRLAQQSQNAVEIAEKAGALYDKFVAFAQDLEAVGDRIDATRKTYDQAFNKLKSGRGNLIRRTEMLRELGAKTSKQHAPALLGKAMDEDGEPGGPDEDDESAAEPDDSPRH